MPRFKVGDIVKCNTHEYRHLRFGSFYVVERVKTSSYGNQNIKITSNGASNYYWVGNFKLHTAVEEQQPRSPIEEQEERNPELDFAGRTKKYILMHNGEALFESDNLIEIANKARVCNLNSNSIYKRIED